MTRVRDFGVPEERSFGGTLPLLGGNVGFTPVIQGVLPLGAGGTGRSLPTLPVAAPVPLPFVLPVPGVAQPREALPVLPELGLSGLDINPLKGELSTPGGTTFAPVNERTHSPALAGLDAQTLFGDLDETALLPRIDETTILSKLPKADDTAILPKL
jgi:trimeric autotransporter adhesin